MHASVLRYIVEVARHRSIRKAGAALNIASSGINQRILSLERELGVQLFVRSPGGMAPTKAGRLLLRHARQTLSDYDNLIPLISDVRELRAGHVRVACDASIHERVFPEIFTRFMAAHPKVTLSVYQTAPEEVIQAIEDGHAEIGLTYSHFPHQSARQVKDYPAPFGVVVPMDNVLATKESITLAQCLESPLIRYCRPGGRDTLLDDHIERESLAIKLFCHTNSLAFAKEVIASGKAVGISSSYGFIDELEQRRAAFVPIAHPALSTFRLGVFIPANRHLDPIERQLTAVVYAVLAKYAQKPWNMYFQGGASQPVVRAESM